jgi:hypothetical protein
LIFRRGAGKTFSVLKELINLSHLQVCGGYTTFLYVSDKTNDASVNELINHIALKVRIAHDLIDAKSAYENILNKNL